MSRRALWPVGTDPAVVDGTDQSPTAAPTGQPSAPSGVLPVRSATLAEIAPVVARHAALARLGNLLSEAAGILHELSQVPLADTRDSRLMSHVETTSKPARLLSVRDVAEHLALSEKTVRRLRRQGVLPHGIEIAGTIRWRPEEIEAWIG